MKKLALFYIMFLIVYSCKKKKEKSIPLKAEEEIFNFEIYESKEGKKLWILKAKKAFVFEEKTKVKKLKIYFLSNKDTSSILTADSGLVDNKNGNLYAFGNVEVFTKEGAFLKTTFLMWNSERKRIITDKNIYIKDKGREIYGKGLEATPDLKEITIKQIKGKTNLNK